MTDIDFRSYGKTPRLRRQVLITEKIDGTNAAVVVTEDGRVAAQSRNRLITPENDNFGFAKWVARYSEQLADTLGEGYHYGEWWGSGIQRGYGLEKGEKRFSLFDVPRYANTLGGMEGVPGLGLVPVVGGGILSDDLVDWALDGLALHGSRVRPGFMHPEGIIVRHLDSRQHFKVLIDQDHISKTEAGAA